MSSIKRLRQERNWLQAQLAQRLNVHQKQVSGYKRNVHVPSMEALIHLAELLDVSLDYLAFEDREDSRSASQIAARDLLSKMEEVDKLPEVDKATIKAALDSFILKSRFQRLAHAVDSSVAAR